MILDKGEYTMTSNSIFKIIMSLFILSSFNCCVRGRVYYKANFKLKGSVYDIQNKTPIANVKIKMFVDKGLNSYRSKPPTPLLLKGTSDSLGKINCNIEFIYEVEEGIFSKQLTDTCVIELSKDGYGDERYNFRVSELHKDSTWRVIQLDTVFLVPTGDRQ
jgi:hypothetical protein